MLLMRNIRKNLNTNYLYLQLYDTKRKIQDFRLVIYSFEDPWGLTCGSKQLLHWPRTRYGKDDSNRLYRDIKKYVFPEQNHFLQKAYRMCGNTFLILKQFVMVGGMWLWESAVNSLKQGQMTCNQDLQQVLQTRHWSSRSTPGSIF